MSPSPRNRAERRAALRKTGLGARAALTASTTALGTIAALLGTAGPAGAATITVDTTADGDDGECVVDCTLREAIDLAASGDTVNFGVNGTITLLGAYGGQLDIDKNLTISGPGAANLSVDGAGSYRVFYIYDSASNLNVTISGITIQEGSTGGGPGGGVVTWGENLTLTSTVVTGNEAGDGGGVAGVPSGGTDPTVTVNGTSTFENNNAYYEGGGISMNGGTLEISGTTRIDDNYARSGGGGLYLDNAALSISGATTIVSNTAKYGDGGGIGIDDNGVVTITGASITGNEALYGNDGGGIYIEDPDSDITISGTTISNNTADEGGGIYLYGDDDGALIITGSTISGNTADDEGGGIYLYNLEAALSITGTTISNNTAGDEGGGIFLYETDSPVEIANTTISGNTAGDHGGGIYWYDTDDDVDRTIRNTTISGNTSGSRGGGMAIIAVEDAIQVVNSTISGNTASEGGAVYLDTFGYYAGLDFTQATITDNRVTGGTTGGIFLESLASLNAAEQKHDQKHAEKVAEKDAEQAAEDAHEAKTWGSADGDVGAQNAERPRDEDGDAAKTQQGDDEEVQGQVAGEDELALIGTILSGNDGNDLGGTTGGEDVVTSDHSLIGTVVAGAGLTDLGGTIFSTDPGLAPLADNGGPTLTHALLATSPALDAGPDPVPTFPGNEFDQRGAGFARVINGLVDIGAFEAELVSIVLRFTG